MNTLRGWSRTCFIAFLLPSVFVSCSVTEDTATSSSEFSPRAATAGDDSIDQLCSNLDAGVPYLSAGAELPACGPVGGFFSTIPPAVREATVEIRRMSVPDCPTCPTEAKVGPTSVDLVSAKQPSGELRSGPTSLYFLVDLPGSLEPGQYVVSVEDSICGIGSLVETAERRLVVACAEP